MYLFFWIIACLDLVATGFEHTTMHGILKSLLMPVLICAVYLESSSSTLRTIIITGLFFSFLGDIFLLFDHRDPLFFLAGLLSFLATHILYISYFLKVRKTNVSLIRKGPWLILAVMVYTAGLLYLLVPKLGDLVMPVIVYACILSFMLICSLHVYNSINRGTGLAFIIGAICFVISDSLLAVNKFYTPLPYAGILIMLTYCTAQYLIVRGFIKAAINK